MGGPCTIYMIQSGLPVENVGVVSSGDIEQRVEYIWQYKIIIIMVERR